MATDDRRMHEGRSRSLDDREPREPRDEESVIGRDADGREDEVTSTTDREQESALGGHVATRSGAAEAPEDKRD
ncbi:hypothetical protein [Sphingomonas sp. LM7]|uniref:hypothetical protein n=1 Tax=Sphingomonas sp. LM7 TaxID=1938607 RepID=UPI000983BB2B|nr:hypothetical protein [Sphingomonas sp. LM7]AQR73162.1 hypothetical protein BXU08_05230 [Sphingomonas sp. LM7]